MTKTLHPNVISTSKANTVANHNSLPYSCILESPRKKSRLDIWKKMRHYLMSHINFINLLLSLSQSSMFVFVLYIDVCMFVYVCIYVHIYIIQPLFCATSYICVYIGVHVYPCICMCIHVCTCMNVYMQILLVLLLWLNSDLYNGSSVTSPPQPLP